MIRGPVSIDPSRLDEARRAYSQDMARYRPELVDDKGMHRAQDPFVTTVNENGEKETYFNRWIASENDNSAQNAWFNTTDDKGKKVRLQASYQFPEYAYNKSQGQFDSISGALNDLQNRGFLSMQKLYDKAMRLG